MDIKDLHERTGAAIQRAAKVFVETRWFVECPECGAEHDVDAYYSDEIECVCGTKFEFDNGNPENAESV